VKLHPVVRRATRVAGRTILVAVMVASAFVAVGPRTGRYQVLTVLSDSMAPSMRQGALVVSMPFTPGDVRVGDVVTMRSPVDPDAVVTHRVIEIVEPGGEPVVRTKGDANESPDPWLARLEGDRAWRATAVVPVAGHAVLALRRVAPRLALTVLAPLLLAVIWLAWIWAPAGGPERHTTEFPGAQAPG
jgi:signal peptidase